MRRPLGKVSRDLAGSKAGRAGRAELYIGEGLVSLFLSDNVAIYTLGLDSYSLLGPASLYLSSRPVRDRRTYSMPSPPKDDAPDAVHMETHEDPAPSDPDPDSGPRNKAAEVLKQAEAEHHEDGGAGPAVVVTPEDNARVLRLIDMRILPILLVVYCLQSLDKTTLSYASVFGIIEDTGLVGDQFSWLGSVVYVAQLVFQPAVAYVLVRFPVGKFAATMVFCWGSILCCMAASHNFAGLMVTRLLLGVFEASVGA